MKRKFWMWGAAMATMSMLAGLFAMPAAAQSTGRLVGEVRDNSGKVWPDCIIVAKSEEMGGTTEVKTDKDGRFSMVGMRPGIYSIILKAVVVNPNAPKPDPKAPPKAPEYTQIWDTRARITAGGEEVVNINIKELIDKAGAAATEARKKQEEDAKKFEGLKAHFDAGHTALELAKPMRGEIDRAPADQKPAMLE
ncbi:MAG: carboxypeptidase regulatory-like domain-containing protein, partial [Acidobacteria bacterium]|nr:carboxypeptidase regulatory-like domain-containing protein [Acidobacteriota bacterium]